jgi:hypothetical protein
MIGTPIVIYQGVKLLDMQTGRFTRMVSLVAVSVVMISYLGGHSYAFADTSSQLESHTITGSDLQNNPVVAKILSEIEYSKKQVAQLEKNQKDQEANQKLIDQQRQIAKQLEDQAYQILQTQTLQNSSDNAYLRFLDTVPSNDTKKVFQGEFAFTKQRIDAGHAAMQQVLAKGGTWEDAMQEFSKYAAIKHVEMVTVNQQLNDQYIQHPNIANMTSQQIPFDENGRVPDDYIKLPSAGSNDGKT